MFIPDGSRCSHNTTHLKYLTLKTGQKLVIILDFAEGLLQTLNFESLTTNHDRTTTNLD